MTAPLPLSATRRVLIVDDEPEVGELVAAAAEGLGLASTVLTSALRLDEAMDPGMVAVVIDLMLPGMDGIELVRQLAQRACRAPVVLMSGHDKSVLRSAEQVARSLGLRTAGRLQKPFRLSEMEDLLRTVMHAAPVHPAAVAGAGTPLDATELRDALCNDRIVLHYQPQVALADGRTVGVEALVRVLHPTRGTVYPDSFIALAEELRLIDALTDAVMRHALAEVAGLPSLAQATLSINVSACSLTDLSLPDRLADRAEEYGLPLSRVMVEITESGLIKEFGKALDILARLRLRGAGLSIDDFGTGYSSMAQLRRIPCTELKIDRSFVNDMLVDDAARALIEETIALGHRLGLKVVAEGVETAAQADALRNAGCDIAQGFLFARPLPAAALDGWLVARGH